MGDNLPPVELGTTERVKSVVVGQEHTCVLLEGGSVKCWGQNVHGQLGIEAQDTIGHTPATMGSALKSVDLGGGTGQRRNASKISAGEYHTCAILEDTSELNACSWGLNSAGELGIGDSTHWGTAANSMGDQLPAVFLGAGRTAKDVFAGGRNTCALLDNNDLKWCVCWQLRVRGVE
eukprot:3939505-Rhodomonas_salina.1